MDYKSTLNLPQTEFPMRAGLPEREPEQIKKWKESRIAAQIVEKNQGGPRFLLHDGPPYANGDIHIGHALNKVLKDVVVKHKGLMGCEARYIPGWDCHGLPIELGVEKQLIEAKRDKATVPIVELRGLCRAYAERYIDVQREQFQRLEIFGDWEHPYATMHSEYVASIVRELGRCAETGALYKGNKPVHWCPSCGTALAEAEIEYADKKSPSIYVKFDLTPEALASFAELAALAKQQRAVRTSVIIWTTTPWTLPANQGVALHPEFDYSVIGMPTIDGQELWILAEPLREKFFEDTGIGSSAPLLKFKAEKLHRQKLRHPLFLADSDARRSLVILGQHVTADAGTGAVHTAPGHGVDDYRVGLQYGLEVSAPIDDRGKFTAEYAPLQGQFALKANAWVIEQLASTGSLVAQKEIQHSYPHCWRCHGPVLFRATPQWFINIQELKKKAEEAIHAVKWIPGWGINRILAMVGNRPDWCISRQRVWGTPITVFYCEGCQAPLATPAVFQHVASIIEKQGVDAWFTEPVEKLLPPGAQCAGCGQKSFRKERDILDVWFDSGVSHAAVCEARGLGWPAELYLEGSDQHRGWFQTSLLTSVATRGKAPFKTVLTHGFVNDKDGKKMSKSKGNVTSPLEIMKNLGAEILRLWVVLEDYRDDVSFSKESLERVGESYRKIRNTLRFLLGNLSDFDPERHELPVKELSEIDRWALSRTGKFIEQIVGAYEDYEFHQVYHGSVQFCVVDLSAKYLDILKDRLYTAGVDSRERRSSQTAIYWIARALTQLLAPILSFTSEEVWGFLPQWSGKKESIFLTLHPELRKQASSWIDAEVESRYEKLWEARDHALKALEEARRQKIIGHPREARVALKSSAASLAGLRQLKEDLSRLFLVSELSLEEGCGIEGEAGGWMVEVHRASGEKCARCWVHSTAVGKPERDPKYPGVCDRCEKTLQESGIRL